VSRVRRIGLVALLAALAGPAAAEPGHPAEDAIPRELTGHEIYERVLRNRFDAYVQDSVLVSGDRGEASQESRLTMTWKSFRDPDGKAVESILSKTMVKYTEPFDLRFSGYLIINHDERIDDQFVYLATRRRIRRVNLRSEAIFGTDFTFEDVVPREIEDGDYRRLPDELVGSVPCYVVEVIPKPHADSEYTRILLSAEKQNFVPLRTRYFDNKGLEVKELTVPPDRIQAFDGIHIPMLLTMRNLQLDTYTTLTVDRLVPNPELPQKTFDLRRLESH
jgi:hypothetical protein